MATLPDPRERPVLTVEEAGRFLSLGRSAAYAAVQRGELPVLRLGRRIVCPTAQLARLVGLDPDHSTDSTTAPLGESEAVADSIRSRSDDQSTAFD